MTDLLSLVPSEYLSYVTLAVAVCSALTMAIPAPSSDPLASVWKVLNFVALNFANAKNAAQPKQEPTP